MGKELLELLPDLSAHPEGTPPAAEQNESDEEDQHDDPSTPSKRVGPGLPGEFRHHLIPKDFSERLPGVAAEELAKRRGWVLGVPLFKDLGGARADAIAMALEARVVARKTVVIEKGNVGEQEMYFVAKGKFDVLMSLDGSWPAFVTVSAAFPPQYDFQGSERLPVSAARAW